MKYLSKIILKKFELIRFQISDVCIVLIFVSLCLFRERGDDTEEIDPSFAAPFAPWALPHFSTTMKQSDFQGTN